MRVAIVGATGAVGQEFLELLAERNFPISELKLYASPRSAGKEITFKGTTHTVIATPEDGNLDVEIAFISAGGALSKSEAWKWAEHGAIVIDNSSAWRMDERVPLVIPEVNGNDALEHNGVIANPNCSTIIALMALAPLHRAFGLQRATVATYQAVSGAGAAGITELADQSEQYLKDADSELPVNTFQHPIAFNLFSHDSEIGEDGYNYEERKLVNESRKMLHDDSLMLSATCIRVPVFRAHSEAIHAEFAKDVTVAEVQDVLANAEGVSIVDDRAGNTFPMPITSSGQDDVFVGRIREDVSKPGSIAFFVSGDQIRKGAALNAVQIGEYLVAKNAVKSPTKEVVTA